MSCEITTRFFWCAAHALLIWFRSKLALMHLVWRYLFHQSLWTEGFWLRMLFSFTIKNASTLTSYLFRLPQVQKMVERIDWFYSSRTELACSPFGQRNLYFHSSHCGHLLRQKTIGHTWHWEISMYVTSVPSELGPHTGFQSFLVFMGTSKCQYRE